MKAKQPRSLLTRGAEDHSVGLTPQCSDFQGIAMGQFIGDVLGRALCEHMNDRFAGIWQDKRPIVIVIVELDAVDHVDPLVVDLLGQDAHHATLRFPRAANLGACDIERR